MGLRVPGKPQELLDGYTDAIDYKASQVLGRTATRAELMGDYL
jgi:hypothetical protein